MTQLDHADIADKLRLASGTWITIRTDTPARVHSLLGHWRHDRGKRPRAYSDRYTFRAKSAGYRSHQTHLQARHDPITFPAGELDSLPDSATIGVRTG